MFIEFLQVFLPIIIYILLIVFITVAIILGIKLIKTMDKVDHMVASVSDKVDSLNGVFHVIDFATDKVTDITDKVVDTITGLFDRIIHKKSNKIKEEED